MLNGSR